MRFQTSCLISKFGFEDGDLFLNWECLPPGVDDTELLVAVVKKFIVPQLHEQVELFPLETCHNPVRVSKINGVDVQKQWYEPRRDDLLHPAEIEVPDSDILALAKEMTKPHPADVASRITADEDDIIRRKLGLHFENYEAEPCPNCGRLRVGRRNNGKRICEKCCWDIDAKNYDADALTFRS